MNARGILPAGLVMLGAVAAAGEDEARVRIEVRVVASLPGRVQVDRGADAALQPGDRVRLLPYGAAAVEGTIESVEERSAWVVLQDPAALIDLGIRGEVLVPEGRLQDGEQPAGQDPEHPPWTYGDDPWQDTMPLLAEVKVPKPAERPLAFSGRWYTSYDWTDDSAGYGRSYDYLSTGVDLLWENPFQRGGALQLEAEYDRRSFETEYDDGSEDFLRLERLSYAWGGTREEPRAWEVGRFLQHGMPQFGVLDGVELVQRLESGDRFGASFGLMPEPDARFDSGADVQGAAFYRWVRGESEQLSIGTGIQKTYHDGHADRDLVVGDVRWYPRSGWNASASVWVDVYGSEDVVKGSGPELTQLFASAGYRWERTGLSLSVMEIRFPELLRNEFEPILAEDLADNKLDRVTLSGWRRLTDDLRLRARVDQWNDEDGSGGGGALGLSVTDWLGKRTRLDFELFTNDGQFSSVVGGRIDAGVWTEVGSFDLGWELGQYEQEGFEGTAENLDQHRLRLGWDLRTQSEWDLSLYVENRFGDEQDALTLGFYLQRSF